MRIEIFKSGTGKQPWFWHFRARNGRITANNESFPTKNNALRAAKAVVRGVFKEASLPFHVIFTTSTAKNGVTSVWWS